MRKAIEEAEAMLDHLLKQYALFTSFEEDVAARKTPGGPRELAEQPHAQAYSGAMRLVLGEEAASR